MAKKAPAGDLLFEQIYQKISGIPKQNGISQVDVMTLPALLAEIFTKIMRHGQLTESEFAAELNITRSQIRQLGQLLVEKGYLSTAPGSAGSEQIYRVNFTHHRKRRVPTNVWKKLDL